LNAVVDLISYVSAHPRIQAAQILALWREGCMSSEAVVQWADDAIRRSDVPDGLLMDLSYDGPQACLKRQYHEFPVRNWPLSFNERFALRALALDLDSDEAVLGFMNWAYGEGSADMLPNPDVLLAYQAEHIAYDANDIPAALSLMRRELQERCERLGRTAAEALDRALV
jgi:hypothetical protein